ncbi:TPA: flagellar protein FlgN [Candidatus Poribacteria bacterium]|jgi:flagellar biosynthesis/type III secretory pathway chaperone|nr:flagellar protein FlgN [Candidatus Poribacteria bacterium]HIA70729.1 flagellar protein FlgN [Candidatus Poribacteria bacterium]HIB86509.1 flagellar protein FlgN [Candidatus Poribacteria bacterium]HIB98749.1 flagellar protein FlgN [Candidatus Poribacteria bacterium]HIC19000.1 flagellar protein FlgN [Candidatus Poribacteria bacterium]
MQEQLLNLYNLVRYELEEYNQLLELLYQERQVLVERKIGDLADLISEKEKLIYSINNIESERDDLLAELSALPDVGPKSLDAATLIELAEGPLKSRFTDVFDEVQRVKTEFEYINATNKELLQSEHEYVSFLIDQVTRIEEPGKTYEDDGSLRPPAGKGMYDHHI